MNDDKALVPMSKEWAEAYRGILEWLWKESKLPDGEPYDFQVTAIRNPDGTFFILHQQLCRAR